MGARRALRALGPALVALALSVVLPAGSAWAEEGSIAHVEATSDGLRILVDVPAGTNVDLAGVRATLDGTELDATASSTRDGAAVSRTTVLAIDTSQSMAQGGRFAAAKEAATTYLDAVPSDVEVGIVTFDNTVEVALEPTVDRDAARTVVAGLALAQDTLLYDGVMAAIDAAGDSGQRTVLLLSDGADAGSTHSLDDATARIEDSNTRVDIVALDLPANRVAPLRTMASAGRGEVITSSGTALADAFAAEAEVLTGQVLVSAPLPQGFDADVATVEVTLPVSGGGEAVTARALAPIEAASGTEEEVSTALPSVGSDSGWAPPDWVLWAGLATLAVGLVTAAVLLVPAPPPPLSIADRVAAYSTHTRGAPAAEDQRNATEPVLDQVKAAAAGVLERNSGLNERMTRRLSAAGSEFKPSEWLLVHIGSVLAAAVVGLVLGGGNIFVGVAFLAVGFVLPPLFLTFQIGRRQRAFDAALPEVLQLLSGALSAGLSLAQAVDTVVREGPEPIASEFKRVLVEARIGVQLEDAFEGVAERFQSKDFAWAVMAIRIQRQVGGNLAELLTTVAGTMRERQFLRRHVRALSAEGRLSAVILCGLPPLFGLYLFATNREFLSPLVADVRGWLLLGFGVIWMSIGAFWMSRMVKVEA